MLKAAVVTVLAIGHLALVQGDSAEALRHIRTIIEFGYELEMSRFDRTESSWLFVGALVANDQQTQARLEYQQLFETESAWINDDTTFKQRILAQTF